jgi:hypothetical protein
MAKINLDKYYTPADLAEYCVKKTKEVIGEENITEWLEPSAGAGVFLPYLDNNYLAFDIEPEADNIEQKNYLELDLPYFKGRCVIGNPPFGTRNTLSVKFYKNSLKYGDYIAFILPISQYKNNQQMYEFDMVYSEELPLVEYSGVELLCCFNIYKRPKGGINTKPNKHTLKDITIKEVRKSRNQYLPKSFDYDYALCTWGDLGKTPNYQGEFNQEAYIRINNQSQKINVVNCLKNADWIKLYKMERSPRLKQWQILKYLKEQIPNLN